jgi:hypothetical protein
MWTSRTANVTVWHVATNGLQMSRHALLALLSFVIAMSAVGPGSSTLAQTSSAEEALVKKARAVHEKVITLDTHIDFAPADLVGERN